MSRNTLVTILVIIGGILQLIYMGINGFFSLIIFVVILLGAIFIPGDPLMPLALATQLSLLISVIAGFILMIVYFIFATNPGHHKKGLLFAGILGFLLGGLLPSVLSLLLLGTYWPLEWVIPLATSFIPGLLVLLGGIFAQSDEA
jgi:hypothetical protein